MEYTYDFSNLDNVTLQANADSEKQAKKALTDSLFRLYYQNKVAFLDALHFNEKNAVERFKTTYTATDANGKKCDLETSVRFTIFNLWNDVNDPKKEQRKAINGKVRTIADMASNDPCKEDRQDALDAMKECYRLLGFSEVCERLNATDAKKLLVAVYRMADNGKDDARDSECKRCLQALLYKIMKNVSGNARQERAIAKKAKSIK